MPPAFEPALLLPVVVAPLANPVSVAVPVDLPVVVAVPVVVAAVVVVPVLPEPVEVFDAVAAEADTAAE
jgi:hypothetical protein